MREKSDLNDQDLNEKLEVLLDENNEIRKWNEGLLIKLLILLPIIIFLLGLFIINRPENLKDLLFVLIYPIFLIFIGLMILFIMRSNIR